MARGYRNRPGPLEGQSVEGPTLSELLRPNHRSLRDAKGAYVTLTRRSIHTERHRESHPSHKYANHRLNPALVQVYISRSSSLPFQRMDGNIDFSRFIAIAYPFDVVTTNSAANVTT